MPGAATDVDRTIRAAASLSERIAYGLYDSDPLSDPPRLQHWLEKSAQGNSLKFSQRLAWENLDTPAARRIMASDPVALKRLPEWAPLVTKLLAYLADAPANDSDDVLSDGAAKSIPFAQVLSPLAAFGMRRLEEKVSTPLLSDTAALGLQIQLLKRICGLSDLALGEEFLRFRLARGWQAAEMAGTEEPGQELYSAFVETLRHAGLVQLFVRYPVLARLLATTIEYWVEDISSFLLRFASALPEIERRFFAGEPLPPVRAIQSSLSDPHRKGCTVKIVVFEDGRKIVYKPKSLAIDEAWARLTAWLSQIEPGLDLRAPRAWNCGDYGWVEHIEHRCCEGLEGVRKFYRRAGMLTSLFYVFQATDFHHENLIASGEYPVPIDLETVFAPDPKMLANESENLTRKFLGTVLRSFMLPNWQLSPDQKTAVDFSGLGSFADSQYSGTDLRWRNVNTDEMQLCRQRKDMAASQNMPALRDSSIDPYDFVPEIVKGFELGYRALMRNRAALLDSNGPLTAFRECSARIVFRATRIYGALLRRSLTPRLLVNGMDRSLEFEGLSRAFLTSSKPYEGHRLFHAELEALEQLDVPYFEAATESAAVHVGAGSELPAALDRPSFDAAVDRLHALTEADLEYQVELIRSSFEARKMGLSSGPSRSFENTSPKPLSSADLIKRAEAIAGQIQARAIWDGDAAYWLGLDYIPGPGKFSLQPVGPSLYSGRGGIGLFFAALHALSGREEHRRLAVAAAASISRDLFGPKVDTETATTLARSQGIGGAAGLAGIAYSLVKTAGMLNEPELVDDALRISHFISKEDIAADTSLDVISGAAGSILGLLPLWKETGDKRVLAQISQCAEHLIARQRTEGEFAGAWLTLGERPLTGFSHGAAGVSYALFRAHAVTGHAAFRESALRGLSYERSLFLATRSNWPDLRDISGGEPASSWCHGAPGIGLARLGCLAHDASSATRDEIDASVHWLRTNPLRDSDHLCCGELGNIELLLTGGRCLNRSEWIHEAQQRGASVVARAEREKDGVREGFHSNHNSVEYPFTPGLFDGLAGIGYQLLRLAASDRVPCVLLWE